MQALCKKCCVTACHCDAPVVLAQFRASTSSITHLNHDQCFDTSQKLMHYIPTAANSFCRMHWLSQTLQH